jgi:hypothetical protein
MYVLSFTPNDRGIAVDADLCFLFSFILEHFPAGNKAIKEEMCKTEIRADDQSSRIDGQAK